LHDLLRARYALHLLFTKFREFIDGIRKILEGMTGKVDIDSELLILTELEVVDKSEPEVVDESESEVIEPEPEAEVEAPLVETFVDLPTEPIMEVVIFVSYDVFLIPEVV